MINPYRNFVIVAAASLAIVGTIPVHAASSAAEIAEMEAKFVASDTDGDGELTKAEAETGGMSRIAKNFKRIDKDKSGTLTLDEIKAMMSGR